MFDAGILKAYLLSNVAPAGDMPREKLVKICEAYYEERSVSTSRAYLALSADQRIDMLVRIFNTALPTNAEYVILEDGLQYRITMKQKWHDNIDLTLVRLEDYLDVAEDS